MRWKHFCKGSNLGKPWAEAWRLENMGIQAVVWDFDGVLLDSELLHMEAETETFKKFGFSLPMTVMKQYFGIKLEDYFGEIAERYGMKSIVHEMIRTHYETLVHYYGEVFPLTPHALEVLNKLAESYDMAIATSRERELAQLAMKRWSLDTYFKSIIYGDDVRAGKPDPEPFLRACGMLGVQPSVAVAVEDAEAGLISAKKAGMDVIALKSEHNRGMDFSRADRVVEDLREIPGLLQDPEGFRVKGVSGCP
jgi:HAD superfamily hydrolase (TIGR01509 family)